MTTHSVTPLVGISSAQLRDDVQDMLTANGFTPNDVVRLEKQLAYRKTYNLRPEVKERRKIYTAQRNAKMKALKVLLTNVIG